MEWTLNSFWTTVYKRLGEVTTKWTLSVKRPTQIDPYLFFHGINLIATGKFAILESRKKNTKKSISISISVITESGEFVSIKFYLRKLSE